jgi:hypothetical protein
MAAEFSTLERTILKAKGLSDDHLWRLGEIGVAGREDFKTIGDASTLLELIPELDLAVAMRVLEWANPAAQASEPATSGVGEIGGNMVLNTSDSVFCTHCGFKQPKDYSPGDLCPNCGMQAEPIETCFWCGASGPGKFCRSCGAVFVSTAELSLAVLLRRDGVAKDDIPARLKVMTQGEKDALWGRVRRARM